MLHNMYRPVACMCGSVLMFWFEQAVSQELSVPLDKAAVMLPVKITQIRSGNPKVRRLTYERYILSTTRAFSIR